MGNVRQKTFHKGFLDMNRIRPLLIPYVVSIACLVCVCGIGRSWVRSKKTCLLLQTHLVVANDPDWVLPGVAEVEVVVVVVLCEDQDPIIPLGRPLVAKRDQTAVACSLDHHNHDHHPCVVDHRPCVVLPKTWDDWGPSYCHPCVLVRSFVMDRTSHRGSNHRQNHHADCLEFPVQRLDESSGGLVFLLEAAKVLVR